MNLELKPPSEHSSEQPTKLTDRTMVSVHIVVMLVVFVIWLIRLSDRVETQGQAIAALQRQQVRCCKSGYEPRMENTHDE